MLALFSAWYLFAVYIAHEVKQLHFQRSNSSLSSSLFGLHLWVFLLLECRRPSDTPGGVPSIQAVKTSVYY